MANKSKVTADIKKKICKAVERNQIIWDKTEKGHSNRNAIKKAWARIAIEVGVNEELCKCGWKSVRDSQRYHRRKPKVSGSACDLELDMEVEYLSSSCEPWELREEVEFLVEPSLKRPTDSSNIFEDQNNEVSFEPSSSLYLYKEKSTSSPKTNSNFLNSLAETGSQLAQSMCKIVEIAEREKCIHSGFLSHLSSIMDGLSNKTLLKFQAKTIQSAYEMLGEE